MPFEFESREPGVISYLARMWMVLWVLQLLGSLLQLVVMRRGLRLELGVVRRQVLTVLAVLAVAGELVPAPDDRLEVDDVGGRDGGGVDERGGAVRRLRARRVVGDERGPLLGQPHELVRRVVEAGVHAVLEVGRRRDLHLLFLLGEHGGSGGLSDRHCKVRR